MALRLVCEMVGSYCVSRLLSIVTACLKWVELRRSNFCRKNTIVVRARLAFGNGGPGRARARPCGLRCGTLSKLFSRYEICLAPNLPNDPNVCRSNNDYSPVSSPLAGRLAEGGHEGDPGGGGQRDHAQPARVGQPREAADAQATYHRRPARRRGRLHVPAQHGPHEESGEEEDEREEGREEGGRSLESVRR